MKDWNQYDLPCRFIRMITFIDLLINHKFRLFSIGVLFWFVGTCLYPPVAKENIHGG